MALIMKKNEIIMNIGLSLADLLYGDDFKSPVQFRKGERTR